MKKFALMLTALFLWLVPAGAFAAEDDANAFVKEDMTTVSWIDAMFIKKDAGKAYDLMGEDAKKNISKDQISDLGKTLGKDFDALEGARFVSWTRFDQADQIIYLMRFRKQPMVRCELLFTKDGSLENFGLTPIDVSKSNGANEKK
ncbi:hypothetical protein [Mitsuokella sp. oral taxon 131]|uniref:hypothetical protein n=1 Tax=Mitsuokella sp. oral taxon 131 TaxID=1321780 RepID=UPI0003AE052D|nr:hypothetical protein [Mitsuokella sp. oral taxon 131]ERL25255.1 hypothetical protein HMPREF1985_00314 [Mitsuokella sp. oral taxon 131 str. W9106]